MRTTLATTLLLVLWATACAQDKCWIYLKDKPAVAAGARFVSEQAVQNRALLGLQRHQYTDTPLNEEYLEQLRGLGVQLVCSSRWLNAVSAYVDDNQMRLLKQLTFVTGIQPIYLHSHPASAAGQDPDPNYALAQINAGVLKEQQLTARGVRIGVIDGSFFTAPHSPGLQDIFATGRVGGTKDFVAKSSTKFFDNTDNLQDIHGTAVWHMIGGYDHTSDVQYGLATGATFFLARTDDTDKEFLGEEDYWVAGLEWLDSLGVRLVNSSLGYNFFDNAEDNHRLSEMTGQAIASSKAAQIAAEQKGMIIVVAAGNYGKIKNWRVVAAPADARDVISVGATDSYGLKLPLSSIGSELVAFTKPDVACFSSSGTSISAPVITGLIACLLEKDPALNMPQIKGLLARAGNLYPYANNYLGYGIPDAGKMLKLLSLPADSALNAGEEKKVSGKIFRMPVERSASAKGVLFHKKDERIVSEQLSIRLNKGKIRIRKPGTVSRSTLVLPGKMVEIIWE
ncbi:MAG: S8 family serine peptidase [Cytophagales bacterium]|nr:S8 family serine peptidase [Cytophagales bacterium]